MAEQGRLAEDLAAPPITEFKGRWGFLSNFYPARFVYEGVQWPSAEHAYQAMKVNDPKIRTAIAMLATAGAAKRFGKKVVLRPGWEQVKLQVMHDVVLEKFKQNPLLLSQLLQTGDQVLEEGNWWHDSYWGIYPPRGRGENYLGKILMQIREELRK